MDPVAQWQQNPISMTMTKLIYSTNKVETVPASSNGVMSEYPIVAKRSLSGSVTGCSPKTSSAIVGAYSVLRSAWGSTDAAAFISDKRRFKLGGSLTSTPPRNEIS